MTRNEFVAQAAIRFRLTGMGNFGATDLNAVGSAENLADALEEAKCAPWVVQSKSCAHAWGTYIHSSALVRHCQKCGTIEGKENPDA